MKLKERMCENRKNKTSDERLKAAITEKNRKKRKRKNQTLAEKLIEKSKLKDRMCKNRENKKMGERSQTSETRVANFRKAVRYGPIFPCCSCEQMMFENGVVKLTKGLLQSIENECKKRR